MTPQEIQDTREQIKLMYLAGKGFQQQAISLEEQYIKMGVHDIGCVAASVQLEKLITQNPEMLELKRRTELLAHNNHPVLITGESGTGKGIIARALHGHRAGNFIQVNCTSLPDELIESELFGHVKGAFTGAIADKVGKFQHAAGGTLFLDEIGDMPLNMQTKLLKVIEEKWICRVGITEELKIDCRIVCATNQDIAAKIRQDLFWRISTFELKTVPLRDRVADINIICKSINPKFPTMEYLECQKPYPGNVRELQQLVHRWEVFG